MSLTWTPQNAASESSWQGIAFGNNVFLCVSSSDAVVMRSSDGITWTLQTAATANSWRAICYGAGLFVAVAAYSGSGDRVMTSPDGITWTSRVSAADNDWWGVCYGNGIFVAVAISGTGNRVMTSPDGIVWTSRNTPADNNWYSVCYGNGLFVAVADSGANRVMTSPDGINWTLRTAAAAQNFWYGIAYGNNTFVAVSEGGFGPGSDPNNVMTSSDGITWTMQTCANSAWQVCYGNGLFVSVDPGKVSTSLDGITWNETSPNYGYWQYVTYGNGQFVATSPDSGFNQVMTAEWNPAPICFNKGTKILCLNNNLDDEYVPVENLKTGCIVKSYKHGYRKLYLIGNGSFVNDVNKHYSCMYKMAKTEKNGLIEDLIVTGGHAILVNSLGEQEESNKKFYGENVKIDDKFLHVVANCGDFEPIQEKNVYTYYHFILENDGDNDARFGVWANGVLTETPSFNQFIKHDFIGMVM